MIDRLFLLMSIHAALEAGNAILQVYRSDFEVEEKADRSPLTLADRRSHEIIVERLERFDLPILSEEGKDIPYTARKSWDSFWLVDPLDGTKEFVKKNGEFTVNIAMISDGKPIAGVIYVPDKGIIYFASNHIGAYKVDFNHIVGLLNSHTGKKSRMTELPVSQIENIFQEVIGKSNKLPLQQSRNQPFTIVGSRSHATAELEEIVEQKRKEYGDVELISAGSSLKFCLVAEGRADIYPRTGPTMEWDTAAGQAIVENAGGSVLDYDTRKPLKYNKENLLNRWFVVSR